MRTDIRVKLQNETLLKVDVGGEDTFAVGMKSPLPMGGTKDYEKLNNKPSINSVTLIGNRSLEELGVQAAGMYPNEALTNEDIETIISNFA